jgi:hypothetical protein
MGGGQKDCKWQKKLSQQSEGLWASRCQELEKHCPALDASDALQTPRFETLRRAAKP